MTHGDEASDGRVIIINVFRLKDGASPAEAVERLAAVNRRIAREPGFLEATAHRGRDGTVIANHAVWRTETSIREALAHPELAPLLDELLELADGDWHLYDVADRLSA